MRRENEVIVISLKRMEPITLTGLAIAFCSGMFTKASEDTFDALRNLLQKRLAGTLTGKALAAGGGEIDPRQMAIDVEAIAIDPEMENLVAQVNGLLAQNQDLKQQVEQAIAQAKNDTTITINAESHDSSKQNVFGKFDNQGTVNF